VSATRQEIGSSQSKSTPGPWHWKKARTVQHLHNEAGNCFAQVSMPAYPPGEAEDQYKADAALIAAAPEMIAALREIARYKGFYSSEKNPTMRAIKRIALEALNKAEGR
jgi:hypothetical protein